MWIHWRYHETHRIGHHDGPAGGKRIRRRTGWRREDEPVCDIAGGRPGVDGQLEDSRVARKLPRQDDVVRGVEANFGTRFPDGEHRPFGYLEATVRKHRESVVEMLSLDAREIAESADVESCDRLPRTGTERSQYRTVAAERDYRVRFGGRCAFDHSVACERRRKTPVCFMGVRLRFVDYEMYR